MPHLTNLVKEKIRLGYESVDADVSIIEIGGTVGDMENEYLLESARQLRHELGETNVQFVHVALLPFLIASKELKTKPIQHSIRTLMSYGISPDFLIVRADAPLPQEVLFKIGLATGIEQSQIISATTLDSIYRVPLAFHAEQVGEKILKKLALTAQEIDMSQWTKLLANIDTTDGDISIGLV